MQTEREVAEKEEARLMRSLQRIAMGGKVKVGSVRVTPEIEQKDTPTRANIVADTTKPQPTWKLRREEERKLRELREEEERAAKERVIKRSINLSEKSSSFEEGKSSNGLPRSTSQPESIKKLFDVVDARDTATQKNGWASRSIGNWDMPINTDQNDDKVVVTRLRAESLAVDIKPRTVSKNTTADVIPPPVVNHTYSTNIKGRKSVQTMDFSPPSDVYDSPPTPTVHDLPPPSVVEDLPLPSLEHSDLPSTVHDTLPPVVAQDTLPPAVKYTHPSMAVDITKDFHKEPVMSTVTLHREEINKDPVVSTVTVQKEETKKEPVVSDVAVQPVVHQEEIKKEPVVSSIIVHKEEIPTEHKRVSNVDNSGQLVHNAAELQQQEIRHNLSSRIDSEITDITRVESIVRHTNTLRNRPVVDPVMDELISMAVLHCKQVLSTIVNDPANFARFQFEESSRQMVRSIVSKLTAVEMTDEQRRGIVIVLKTFTTAGFNFLQNYSSHMLQAHYDTAAQQVRNEIKNVLVHFRGLRSDMNTQPKAVLSRSLHKVSCMASDIVSSLQNVDKYRSEDNIVKVQEYINFLRHSILPFMEEYQQESMASELKGLLRAGIQLNQSGGDISKREPVIEHLLSSLRAMQNV